MIFKKKIRLNGGPKTEWYQVFFRTVANEVHSLESQIQKTPEFKKVFSKPLSEKERSKLSLKLDADVLIMQKKLKRLENTLQLTLEDHLEYDFLNHSIGLGFAIKDRLFSSQRYIGIPEFSELNVNESISIRLGLLRLNAIKTILKKYELTK